MQTAARGQFTSVEVGMRIQPKYAQKFALVAAMAGDRCDGSNTQAVIPSQQYGQTLFRQLPIDGIVHFLIPSGDLSQIAVAVDFGPPGIGGAADIAAIHHVQSTLHERRVNPCDWQCCWSH